jgi:signal transduction histidine kinase
VGVAALAAWGAIVDPRLLAAVLVLAPMLPVAGVAAAYGSWADPMYELCQATPASGVRVLLLRSVAVLASAAAIVCLVAPVIPDVGFTAAAWLLPSIALCSVCLMLATFMPIRRASLVVVGTWLTMAAGAAALGSPTNLFRGAAQFAFFAVTMLSALVLARRRHHIEIANLHARRALVNAADTERRRLERNIHDGAQQHLVAIGVKARLARGLVGRDPDQAIAIIDQVCDDAQAALASLRDLTRGAYPPILADEGLVAALTARARSAPVPVVVEGADVGRLPKELEIAVYFCCSEAIQNAAKYASASSIAIVLRRRSNGLAFSISDDGMGFEPGTARRGIGMRSMLERIEAQGGSLEVRSAPGTGTKISGTIPIDAG